MPSLTNISSGVRALPLISKKYVEFAKGETKDFPDADWAAIKGRASVQAHFKVEGSAPPVAKPAEPPKQEAPEAPVADDPAPKSRAKKG